MNKVDFINGIIVALMNTDQELVVFVGDSKHKVVLATGTCGALFLHTDGGIFTLNEVDDVGVV